MTASGHGPTAIDLFSGAGGLSLGLQQAGFEVVGAVDSWAPAVNTYRVNFVHPVLGGDLSAMTADAIWSGFSSEPRAVDVVTGGPPCQGFSIQRIGSDRDPRNDLVDHFGRLVVDLGARMFLMENVPGLLGRRGKAQLQSFREAMTRAGYDHGTWTINAADFGVPQVRRRVFVVGWRTGDVSSFAMPEGSHKPEEYVTVREAIGDLMSPPADSLPNPDDPLHRRTKLSELNVQRIALIPPGGGFEDLPPELRVRAHRSGAARIGHRYVYGRLHPDRPAGTITARFDSFTRGRFGHPTENRSITLREGARLQTFPDSFRFVGTQEETAALIGNAVPPLLAHRIGTALQEALSGNRSKATTNGRGLAVEQLSFIDERVGRHVV